MINCIYIDLQLNKLELTVLALERSGSVFKSQMNLFVNVTAKSVHTVNISLKT